MEERAAQDLFNLVCAADGEMDLGKAVSRLKQPSKSVIQNTGALKFVKRCDKMFRVQETNHRQDIIALSTIRFCENVKKCKNSSCPKLHVCKFWVKGSCEYDQKCKNDHGFDSPNSRGILQYHRMHELDVKTLKQILLVVIDSTEIENAPANSSTKLPKVCKFYNVGKCTKFDNCPCLHICKYFIDGSCKFASCKRNHNLDTPHEKSILQQFGLSYLLPNMILKLLCEDLPRQRNVSSSSDTSLDESQPQLTPKKKKPTVEISEMNVDKKNSNDDNDGEICGFNLKGKCNYGDKCFRTHCEMPYQWQIKFDEEWHDFPEEINMKIERAFCNVDESEYAGVKIESRPLNLIFADMIGRSVKKPSLIYHIHRLSTTSSVIAPPGHLFSTKWRWFWKDEHNNWISYDDGCPVSGAAGNHLQCSTDSKQIEQDFLNDHPTHDFKTDINNYEIDFDKMIQENLKYGTKRDVRRRPEFVSVENKKEILKRPKVAKESSYTSELHLPPPKNWEPMEEDCEFKLVNLSSSSDECYGF